jgi:hypothetical protein
LLPGKTTIPNFMSVDLDAITLDDRIREHLVGDFGGQRRASAASAVARSSSKYLPCRTSSTLP